jgi:arsenate reductase (glutaredoxin)
MPKFTILHNPRCTKSRNALKLLEDKKQSVDIVEYLDKPLSQKDLKDLLAKADFEAIDLIRSKEAKEFGVVYKDASENDLIKALIKYPKIMQRPVVITAKKATIARDDDWYSRL